MWMAMQRAWSRRRSSGERAPAGPLAWAGLDVDRSLAAWHHGGTAFIGRPVGVDAWIDQPADARAVFSAVEHTLSRLDALWNPDRPSSEIARINAEAAVRPVAVGNETFALLARALSMSRASGGAFDLTGGTVPAAPGVSPAVGWHRVLLDARDRTVRFDRPGLRLAPGDFARGAAMDQIAALLHAAGVRHAVVRSNQAWRFVGDRRGEPWRVSLRARADPAAPSPVLALVDGALVTDGAVLGSEPGAGPGGRGDPLGGGFTEALHGLAVTAGELVVAHALASALRTAGLTDGLRLAATLPDCRAFVVAADGHWQTSGAPAPAALAH